MRYRFNGYEFDTNSLLLTKNEVAQTIRHSEARLLALLLDKAETIVSKDEVLAQVWQHKVVSEQVVFQNISHLRNRFGGESIKTFPKRGYQWQLELEKVPPRVNTEEAEYTASLSTESGSIAFAKQQTATRATWAYSTIVFILTIIIGISVWMKLSVKQQDASPINLAYIPIAIVNQQNHQQSKHQPVTLPLVNNGNFKFKALTQFSLEEYESQKQVQYPALSSSHPYILSGKIREFKSSFYLDFSIDGPVSAWQGQLVGSNVLDLQRQLVEHLSQPVIWALLAKPMTIENRLAQLTIAHEASPKDLIILRKLSVAYLDSNDLDKAMALTEKLISVAKAQNNTQKLGRALLYQSNLLVKKGLFAISAEKLYLAMLLLTEINDLKLLAKAWYLRSWIDHENSDYLQVKNSLLESAKLAFEAGAKRREIDSILHLAKMAHAYTEHDDKYLYLKSAEDKMIEYQLADYHFAKVSFAYASFATNFDNQELYLIRAIRQSSLAPGYWVAQLSKRTLLKGYIKQGQLEEAQALVEADNTNDYNSALLKALLAKAKGQHDELQILSKRAFEGSQLAGNQSVSLDAALLLCQQQIDCEFYGQYIAENATEAWRDSNQEKLLALKL